MSETLGQIIPERLTGSESLPKGATLLNFWQWMGSDLVSNALRGALAEYLVALAVGAADRVQEKWAPYDVKTPDGIKVEVKTSGYIQTWYQTEISAPRFDIAPKLAWDAGSNGWADEKKRRAEVYVFCLHHHKAQSNVNPLDMSQWTFYVLSTAVLEREIPEQESIGIGRLRRLGAQAVRFGGINDAIRTAVAQP